MSAPLPRRPTGNPVVDDWLRPLIWPSEYAAPPASFAQLAGITQPTQPTQPASPAQLVALSQPALSPSPQIIAAPVPANGARQPSTAPATQQDSQLEVLQDFLRTVLPADGPWYFAVTLPSKKSKRAPGHKACQTVEALAGKLLELDRAGVAHDVYFGTAAYQQEKITDSAGKTQRRVARNVSAVRACWLDIDVGEEKNKAGEGYATQDAARAALDAFCKELGIEPTYVLSSGLGLHSYWSFHEPVQPARWKQAAKALKYACTLVGLRADSSRTEDIASILRPVGCTHRKDPANPRRVEILASNECIEFDVFCAATEALVNTRRSGPAQPVGTGPSAAPAATTNATWTAPSQKIVTLGALVDADDLSAGINDRTHWICALPPDEQFQILDSACKTIPETEWSKHPTWAMIIAVFRGLHHLDEAKRLEMLQRHSERSPKWANDGWDTAQLRRKFESFDGGSPSRLFELAEAYGWESPIRANASASTDTDTEQEPFTEVASAQMYVAEWYMFVVRQNAIFDVRSRQLIEPSAFNFKLAKWLSRLNPRSTACTLLMQSMQRRCPDELGYHPGAGEFYKEDGLSFANKYHPYAPEELQPTAKEQAVLDWFINDHLFRRAEDEAAREYFLNALAYPLQNPGKRVASIPLLISETQGNGKSTLLEVVPRLLYGRRNVTVVSQNETNSGFNDWNADAQIICFPEIWMGSAREAEKIANDLKDKITSPELRVIPKGFKGYTQTNRATMFGSSNHTNAVHLSEGDRRWGVHITAAPQMTAAQGNALYEILDSARAAGVLRWIFRHRDLSAFNPMGEPPMTEGKRLSIAVSRTGLEAAVGDLFESKDAPFNRDLFVIGSVKAALVDEGEKADRIEPAAIAAIARAKPISAQQLPVRPWMVVGGVSGMHRQYRVWCWQNFRIWNRASSAEIAEHIATGAMPAAANEDDGTEGAAPESDTTRPAMPADRRKAL